MFNHFFFDVEGFCCEADAAFGRAWYTVPLGAIATLSFFWTGPSIFSILSIRAEASRMMFTTSTNFSAHWIPWHRRWRAIPVERAGVHRLSNHNPRAK